MRSYTNEGQGISSKIQNNYDGRKYIISTAKHPIGYWQLGVFRSILGIANIFKPLRIQNAQTFEEAEKNHFEVENLVANSPIEQWRNSTGIKGQIAQEVDSIEKWILLKSISFSIEITTVERYKDLNQRLLALEALGFFMHTLSRFTFRQNSEWLREVVYDHVFHNMTNLFGETIKQLSTKTPKDMKDIVAVLIKERELEYGQVKTLLGETSSDKESVVWVATNKIADACEHRKDILLIEIIMRNFLQGLDTLELNKRLKRIETLL